MLAVTSACALLLSALLAGCATIPQWRAPLEVRAPAGDVAAALGDSYGGPTHVVDPATIPEPPEPSNLRPCCAFGDDFKIVYGVVPIPGYVLHNMRGPEEIGPHKYNVGLVESVASEDPGGLERENNGLLYTCRSGFIDLAHLREYADMTVYLTAKIERRMDTGGVIELADQGGKRRIRLRSIAAERIADVGRHQLAVALAQWLAFQMATWHELASWYGYAPVPYWPEKMSAFSPEDLYSSLLGIKLAGEIISSHDTSDDIEYGRAMNAWIQMALKRLEVSTKESASAAISAVDGRWWDSNRPLPDWQLLLRRNFDAGPSLRPWLVSMAFAPEPGPAVGCEKAGPPLRLRSPSSFGRPLRPRCDAGDRCRGNGRHQRVPLPAPTDSPHHAGRLASDRRPNPVRGRRDVRTTLRPTVEVTRWHARPPDQLRRGRPACNGARQAAAGSRDVATVVRREAHHLGRR